MNGMAQYCNLFLAAREHNATLADQRVIALLEARNELVRIRNLHDIYEQTRTSFVVVKVCTFAAAMISSSVTSRSTPYAIFSATLVANNVGSCVCDVNWYICAKVHQ